MASSSMRMAFFFKNLVALLTLLFLPIIIMGTLTLYLLHGHIRKNLDGEAQVLLEQLVSKVDLIYEQFKPLTLSSDIDGQNSYVVRKLLDSVEMSYIDIFLLNTMKDQLSSMRNAREYVHSIIIYFANDNNYFLSDTGKHTLSQQDDYWFDSYLDNRLNLRNWTLKSTQSLFGGNTLDLLSCFTILGNGEGVIIFNLRPDYLESAISEGLSNVGHLLAITDSTGQIIVGSPPDESLQPRYLIKSAAAKNGWGLTLYADRNIVFQTYVKALVLFLWLLGLSCIAGIILSVLLTRKRTRQIYSIINLLHSAEQQERLEIIPKKEEATYDYIIHQIVSNFLKQSYLKAQLEARKYKLKTAQLMALQVQMNPHFLFNTLETLNWKVYQMTGSPNAATEMIEGLSDLMRYSLNSVKDTVRLEEEVESIQTYLILQGVRYQGKFSTTYQLEESSLHYRMPRMLLQPIIENALYHGIRGLKRVGNIVIRSYVSDSNLVVEISDDGVGMNQMALEALRESFQDVEQVKTDQIGLANVNARLVLLYGIPLGIESSLETGTTVIIKISQDEYCL